MDSELRNHQPWPFIHDRIYQYWILARFDKPIGIFILLWPTLWAVWLSSAGHPDLLILSVFTLGVIIMRAAGCVINDYADRDFDAHVERTRHRPIATGKVSPKEALVLFFVFCLLAFGLVLLLNRYTILLSFVGAFLAGSYPFMKRYTQLPQAYLGIAFGWAVPMAFAAQTDHIPLVAWLLYSAVFLWALVYDTMYAMVDKEDDIKIGIKSTAILFGIHDKLIIAFFQTVIVILLIFVGSIENLVWPYYTGLTFAALLSIYQQYLIADRNKANCFKAFLNNHWYGLFVFLGIVINYLI